MRVSSLPLLSCLVAASCQTGCTLVGLGVGAIVDGSSEATYERHPPSHARGLERGTNVVLRRRDGASVDGKFLGVTPSRPRDIETNVVVETEDGIDVVAESKLRGIDTRKAKYGWLVGGAVGLVLDLAALTLAAASASAIGDFSQSPAAKENGGGW